MLSITGSHTERWRYRLDGPSPDCRMLEKSIRLLFGSVMSTLEQRRIESGPVCLSTRMLTFWSTIMEEPLEGITVGLRNSICSEGWADARHVPRVDQCNIIGGEYWVMNPADQMVCQMCPDATSHREMVDFGKPNRTSFPGAEPVRREAQEWCRG
jgi:hypothetical protein